LDKDENSLLYYGVSDDAVMLLNELNPNEKRSEENVAARKQQERISQQEHEALALRQLQMAMMGKGMPTKAYPSI
jgi:hypothetical protein